MSSSASVPEPRYCISYPKSGRTWLRVMLGAIPAARDVIFQHDGFEFNEGSKPAHSFSVEQRLAAYPCSTRLIYLERDPRDVMVSLYHQVTGRFRDFFGYSGSLSQFIRDDYFGAMSLQRFRRMWAQVLEQRPFLKITYERMHADTKDTLCMVLDYLELGASEAELSAALEVGSLKAMRELELSGKHPEPWLRPRMGHTKVRRGVVGSHKDELTPGDTEYLNQVFGLK